MNLRKTMLVLCIATGAAAGAAPALADVYVRIGPPAPRYEAVPVLQPGWVWAPGYWNWNGHRCVGGRAAREPRHRAHLWVPHRWDERAGRRRMDRGHWDRD